jgi:hypothetical protein
VRLQRIHVAELRQFRAPFELADIQPGLNVFTGPNEAGKSTLVRAIRAAFFERHRSTSVEDLRPYGDSSAAPLVELDFDIAGTTYRLTKSFLHRKRCDLVVDTRRLEGVEAEDFIAERLGFQFAPKGASREEHWGIPGLLWIEQGSAHVVHDAVVNAGDHLRRALDESLGEVAASGGDEVVTQVRKLRDELLTGTGKPRAAYQKALEDASLLEQKVSELQQSIEAYRTKVDKLRTLREAHEIDAKEKPWVALRAREEQARQALRAIEALTGDRDREREKLRQIVGLRELLAQRLSADERQRHSFASREAALVEAISAHERAVSAERPLVVDAAAATERLRAARAALALARQEHSRATSARQLADAEARATELTSLLQRAVSESERAKTLKRAAAEVRLDPAELTVLREQSKRMTELGIRQSAVATRLRFDLLQGASIDLDGVALDGQGERLLIDPTTLSIPGVGDLHIAPGGSDLAELVQEHAELRDEHSGALQRLGLTTLAEAEARALAHAQSLADASAAEKAMRVLAPKGLDVLQSELDAALARQREATNALAQMPPPPTDPAPSLAESERHHEVCRDDAEADSQRLQHARQVSATAASQRDTAGQERDALKATLDEPRLQAELAAKRLELVEAGVRQAALESTLTDLDARIASARPDILAQDVERLERSADQAERAYQQRDRELVQLEATLAAAGAEGLEEELARAESESTRAQRRLVELRRRAEALELLLQKLELRRQALTRRLQAPLQKHLDRYLQLLFPSGSLQVDETLVPGALARPGPRGHEASDFDTLSFGAREQMGVISRLAYADLLSEAGRPTLIILDDVLVHSDPGRLTQMKRVLFDAAQRHQVLLFTCHPENWRDMGVPLRALRSER